MSEITLEGELLTGAMVIGVLVLMALVFEAPVLGPWLRERIGRWL